MVDPLGGAGIFMAKTPARQIPKKEEGMRNWNHVFWGLTAVLLLALSGCGDSNSPSQALTTSGYVGSEACQSCHADYYADFIDSGHPYKLNKVVSGQIPTYPFSDISGALEQVTDAGGDSRIDKLNGDAPLAGNGPETDNELGTPDSYADVSYVIGGYGWKARWIDADGFIVTGTAVQYNLEDGSMAGYHNDEANKVYNCGNCHTTGWQHYDEALNPNRQDDLPGMDGVETLGKMLDIDNKLPVILNTAYSSYKDDFMTWAAEAYVVKSADLSELKERVAEAVQKRAEESEEPESDAE